MGGVGADEPGRVRLRRGVTIDPCDSRWKRLARIELRRALERSVAPRSLEPEIVRGEVVAAERRVVGR
jgi:hypothetical protein